MIEIRHPLIESSNSSKFAYDALYESGGIDLSDSYYKWILRKLNPIKGKLLVDVSCGRGKLTKIAEEQGLRTFGLDFSFSAVHIAKQKSQKASFILSDGEKISLRDSSADYITHIGNLEHYQDPSEGLREIARLLKPEGIACVLLPNGYSIIGNIQHVRRTGHVFDDGQPIQRYNTYQGWKTLIESNGLVVFRSIRYEHYFPVTKKEWLEHLKRPTRIMRAMFSWMIPFNLSNCFVYFCKRDS